MEGETIESKTRETERFDMTDTPNERTLKIALETFTELANTLKQERDEAREAIRALAEHGESEIQRITKERDKWAELCGQYKQERDEVRRQNEVCRGIIDRTLIARNSALSDLTDLERERDEARKESEYYKERYEQLKGETNEN